MLRSAKRQDMSALCGKLFYWTTCYIAPMIACYVIPIKLALVSGKNIISGEDTARRCSVPGDVIEHTRYNGNLKGWRAAVTLHKVFPRTRIVDGSQCCRICGERYPETKVWQKFKLYNMCECITFDDNFDPRKYEMWGFGVYSIGSCE